MRGQTGSFYHPLGGSQDHKSSEVVLNLQPTQENWHANMLYERLRTLFRILFVRAMNDKIGLLTHTHFKFKSKSFLHNLQECARNILN